MQTGLFTYLQSTSRVLEIARDFVSIFLGVIYIEPGTKFLYGKSEALELQSSVFIGFC